MDMSVRLQLIWAYGDHGAAKYCVCCLVPGVSDSLFFAVTQKFTLPREPCRSGVMSCGCVHAQH